MANDDWLLYKLEREDLEVIVVPDLEQPDQRLVVSGGVLGISGDAIAFGISESDKGGRDLNGDGDMNDVVLHLARRGAVNQVPGDCTQVWNLRIPEPLLASQWARGEERWEDCRSV